MYVEGNRSMIVLKIIIAICLFTGIFSFFWYLQKTKIIEKGLTAARGSIKETTAKRQIEAHANLLIRYKKNKSKLERMIVNPECIYLKILKNCIFIAGLENYSEDCLSKHGQYFWY